MASDISLSSQDNSSDDLQVTAAALWTFVHLKVPRFTSDAALQVVEQLRVQPEEDPKSLAKRLRKLLNDAGVSIKHTAALDAASRILGHSSWHACNRIAAVPTLKLTLPIKAPEEVFTSWRELAPRLSEWLAAWQQTKSVKVFELRFGEDFVLICIPQPKQGGHESETEMYPVVAINPIGDVKGWLTEAPQAFETVRRRLEETDTAFLDGFATLQICGRHGPDTLKLLPPIPQPVTPDDACNSELVLLREDNELMPGSGFEIARGDEITCWSQLELSLKDETKSGHIEIVLDDGAWLAGMGRYVWQMTTLHPGDYIPGKVISALTESESEKLFRRYRLAKRILGGRVKHHHVTKQLKCFGGPEDTYRIDLHRVWRALNDAGYDWDSFCEAVGIVQEKVHNVKIGFVMALAEHLKLKDPNKLFATPLRVQLSKVDDDSLLRTLMPRVDFVRYRMPNDLSPDETGVVRDAIEDFSTSIRVQKMQESGQFVGRDDPLPYLCYASDGEELRLKLESQGLEMYVGVMPHLFSMESLVEKLPNMSPYAFGHSIFLDIDRVEATT